MMLNMGYVVTKVLIHLISVNTATTAYLETRTPATAVQKRLQQQ